MASASTPLPVPPAGVLGVAVRRIRLWQGARVRVAAASDPALAYGFHGYEQDADLRWTDGDALLPPAWFADLPGRSELELLTCGTAQYPLVRAGLAGG